MENLWSFVQNELLVHWPFIAFALVLGVVAQILKTQILTRDVVKTSKVIWWIRRVFPLVLILLGGVVGFFWPGDPSPGVCCTMHKVWYFMASASLSIVGFNAFKQWIKEKCNVDISMSVLPSEKSDPPPRASDR